MSAVHSIITLESQDQLNPKNNCTSPSTAFLRQHPILKVARRIHAPLRITIRRRPGRRVPLRAIRILLQHLVVGGPEIVVRGLRALLLAPQSPRHDRESADEDRAANTPDHTADGLFAGGREAAGGRVVVLQGRGDGRGCEAGGGGHDGIGGDDGAADDAVAGEVGGVGCGDGVGGDEGGGEDHVGGEGGAVDG